MIFLLVNANEMNYVADIHEGITGIHTVIQITSQILFRLFLTELYNAERLTNWTPLLMSTNPRWQRMLTSTPISHPCSHQASHRRTPLTSVPENSSQVRCILSRSGLTKELSEVLNATPILISRQETLQMSSRKRFEADGLNLQGVKTRNRGLNDPDLKEGKSRCLPGTSKELSKAPSVDETPSSTVSLLSTKSSQSTIENTLKKTEGQRTCKLRRRRIISSRLPHLKLDHRPDSGLTEATASYRAVTQNESNLSSFSSQKTLTNEIRNKILNLNIRVPIAKKLASSSSKLNVRSNTELSILSKTVHKPGASKVRSTLPVKLKKHHKRKKNPGSKTCSSSGSSNAFQPFNERLGLTGVKLIAAGQHGFLKNASTGSDSLEASFTIVNVDPILTDLIKDNTGKTTRVAGTSIQDDIVSKHVHFPHPSHRSVCVQADGLDKTSCDTKSLFQKLLPRINALATRRKQPSINTSGQSSYSDFSGSRSYHGAQSVHSCPDRACGTCVNVQYASSGNVKAVVRAASNYPSKYSSQSSTVWSDDRLTPIIQGVSLTQPRVQPPIVNRTSTSKSASSRCSQHKKCS